MIELMFNDSVVFQICTTKSAGQQLIDVIKIIRNKELLT